MGGIRADTRCPEALECILMQLFVCLSSVFMFRVLPGPREPFKRDTASPGTWATEGTVGFLVSRSLTLPAAQPDEPQALFDDLKKLRPKKKGFRTQSVKRNFITKAQLSVCPTKV